MAEALWVLRNPISRLFSLEEIVLKVMPIVASPGLRLANKNVWLQVLGLMMDFSADTADLYHLALAKKAGSLQIYSYDTDFEQLPGVKRLEP